MVGLLIAGAESLFLDKLPLVVGHPLAYVAFIILVLTWGWMAYFLRTRKHLEKLDQLPDADRLTALQALVLGFPKTLTKNRLKVFQWRYLLVAFVATLASTIILAGLAVHVYKSQQQDQIEQAEAERQEAEIRAQIEQAVAERKEAEIDEALVRAIHHTEAGNWAEADAAFREALAINPQHAKTWREHTRMKVHHFFSSPHSPGEVEDFLYDMEETYRQALGLTPDNRTAWNRLGIILKKLGRYAEAIDAYQEAIQRDPTYFPAWIDLATAQALTGRFAIAEKNFNKGKRLADRNADPNYRPYGAQAWRNLASLQHFLGKPEAIDNILEAKERKPDGVAIRVIYARILLDTNDPAQLEKALDVVKYADETDNGKNAKAKRILALAYMRNNRFQQAMAEADAAIELDDSKAINHLIIAVARANLGQPGETREHMKRADDAWPEQLRGKGSHIATAPEGVLWFDTAAELESLRAEAETLLATGSQEP